MTPDLNKTEELPETAEQDLTRRIGASTDRKSTRLNSSHANISYAVFCLDRKSVV